jgi:beta-glucanase (GH16 family)
LIAISFLCLAIVPARPMSFAASRLQFGAAAQNAPTGACTLLSITTESVMLTLTPVTKAATVTVSANNSALQFFSDPACTVAASSIVIAAGQDSANLYVTASAPGAYVASAQASGLTATSQTETFAAAVAAPCSGSQSAPTTPPSQASAAGFKTLVFDDEFNSSSTISPNNSGTYNWYTYNPYSTSAELNTNNLTVSSGCLTIQTDLSGYSYGLSTINSVAPSAGFYQHGYFEARMQFYPAGWQGGAWPAFWSYALEGVQGKSPFAELDFIEAYPGGLGGATSGANGVTLLTTVHQWTTIAGVNYSVQQPNDIPTLPANFNYDAFHIYGCLWTTDSVAWYIDNQLVMKVATGPGTSFTALEQDHMFLILGTGANWPVTYDYVHVWH